MSDNHCEVVMVRLWGEECDYGTIGDDDWWASALSV